MSCKGRLKDGDDVRKAGRKAAAVGDGMARDRGRGPSVAEAAWRRGRGEDPRAPHLGDPEQSSSGLDPGDQILSAVPGKRREVHPALHGWDGSMRDVSVAGAVKALAFSKSAGYH